MKHLFILAMLLVSTTVHAQNLQFTSNPLTQSQIYLGTAVRATVSENGVEKTGNQTVFGMWPAVPPGAPGFGINAQYSASKQQIGTWGAGHSEARCFAFANGTTFGATGGTKRTSGNWMAKGHVNFNIAKVTNNTPPTICAQANSSAFARYARTLTVSDNNDNGWGVKWTGKIKVWGTVTSHTNPPLQPTYWSYAGWPEGSVDDQWVRAQWLPSYQRPGGGVGAWKITRKLKGDDGHWNVSAPPHITAPFYVYANSFEKEYPIVALSEGNGADLDVVARICNKPPVVDNPWEASTPPQPSAWWSNSDYMSTLACSSGTTGTVDDRKEEFNWGAQVFIDKCEKKAQAPPPLCGDVNHDGVFDSSDLVIVYQAGKYDTGQPATFEEGDWNGDGEFDSGDLVLAFQLGHYYPGGGSGMTDDWEDLN